MMIVEIFGNLDEVVRELIRFRDAGFDVYCDFNGHKLYSKDISFDSAYLEVCGCTYSEYLRRSKERIAKWQEEQKREKEKATKNKLEWIVTGHKYIPEQLWSEWEKCIDIRIKDLYNGVEIEYALNIMRAYEIGTPVEKISEMIESQHHSGASYSILKSIITYFYPKGNELFQELDNSKKTL